MAPIHPSGAISADAQIIDDQIRAVMSQMVQKIRQQQEKENKIQI